MAHDRRRTVPCDIEQKWAFLNLWYTYTPCMASIHWPDVSARNICHSAQAAAEVHMRCLPLSSPPPAHLAACGVSHQHHALAVQVGSEVAAEEQQLISICIQAPRTPALPGVWGKEVGVQCKCGAWLLSARAASAAVLIALVCSPTRAVHECISMTGITYPRTTCHFKPAHGCCCKTGRKDDACAQRIMRGMH